MPTTTSSATSPAERKLAAIVDAIRAGKVGFSRNADQWLIVGGTDVVTNGAVVTVTKANGTTTQVRVTDVVKTGERQGVGIAFARFSNFTCTDYDVAVAEYHAAQRTARPAVSAGSPSCCAGCGSRRGRMTVVPDSSGVLGYACPRCVREDAVERSFG